MTNWLTDPILNLFDLIGLARSLAMKHVAAFLLAVLGGKAAPAAEDINAILEAGGVQADTEKVEMLMSELSGKDISEVLAEGRTKLSSMAPAGGAAAAAPAAAEEKAEEKAEEPEDDDDDVFGDDDAFGSLFD
eukprot:gnl/Trimastix_PCT/107.p3 GENE.gnl/Trimastix_PCT/107~~gnl/Trimastix_PCT/107.p3  ORF type:complete len:133 (+),score=42.56 gnl/Trimastix_PCT/107:445-843(+)